LATAQVGLTGSDTQAPGFVLGELAGCEFSVEKSYFQDDLTQDELAALKLLNSKATRRDYPARLVEVIQAWECSLFYRGFQFLIPERGGGWRIPGESTGYGASMQLDLSLLPTNIYSADAQILIATLTRAVPAVRFGPQEGDDDRGITASESAEKFIKVIERNNNLMKIQTDASRYLYTDGRFLYYSRFVKDGQRFGWKEDDVPDNVVPETQPADAQVDAATAPPPDEPIPDQETAESNQPEGAEQETTQAQPVAAPKRKPRGQEIRTAHGKLEVKLSPMSANELADVDCLQYETEISASRAKGRFPQVASKIKAGSTGISEGEIAKLARQNVKLGMQSTYVTSDSVADDVTIQMSWHRPSQFLCEEIRSDVRDSLIQKFPDGVVTAMAGEIFCYARNEGMDDAWALGQAFSGDGQNRNALGTSMLPIQKRVNNWLDLMNDAFIRTVPKKWMHNKAFDVDLIKTQTNVPGDIGAYKPQPGMTADQLIFVEPAVNINESLPDFIREYIGPISQLLSGAYPALSGMEEAGNPTKGGKQIQRDQALGRLSPTWHSIQDAEAASMRQMVRWGAKCRDGSVNEKIPGGEVIRLEVNDLKGNILCYPEADSSFPETHSDKEAKLDELMESGQKSPVILEVLYNPSNLEFVQEMKGLTDLYIPQVAAYNKQLGELEILTEVLAEPVPNPVVQQATETATSAIAKGVDPAEFDQAQEELKALPQEVSTVPVEPWEDHDSEIFCCLKFLMSPDGRKLKKNNRPAFDNVVLHMNEHEQAKSAKQGAAAEKPPSESINYKDLTPGGKVQLAAKGGIQENPADLVEKEATDQANKDKALAAKQKPVAAAT
jgi:hypothetical protein